MSAPESVEEASTLLLGLAARAVSGTVLVGFDFPIGVPASYAERAGVVRFRDLLPLLGKGKWARFYDVAGTADEISVRRPFYPMRPGGTRQHHLTERLDVASMDALLRQCERPSPTRGAASPLFWTLGGKQVGKAAIIGWRDVLGPAVADEGLNVGLWPFDGALDDLVRTKSVVIAETYPAEACTHLGLTPPGRGWSKTSQEGRRAQADKLLRWADERAVELAPALSATIADGFGAAKSGEDPFDAVVGLFSMLEVVMGCRAEGAPAEPVVRGIEGWILGQCG